MERVELLHCTFWGQEGATSGSKKERTEGSHSERDLPSYTAATMPPFAAAPPAMLQLNMLQPPAEEELDSPVESISNMSLDDEAAFKSKSSTQARPEYNSRSVTHPSPTAFLQGYLASPPQRPTSGGRNRSPYSRSHLRAKSNGSSLTAPVMMRSHSAPHHYISRTMETAPTTPSAGSGSLSPAAPHSPMRSPRRIPSPFRQQQDEGYTAPPRSPGFASAGAIESIQEDSELDITPRAASYSLPPPAALASFSRSGSLRRRPASPLHSFAQAAPSPQQHAPTSYPTNVTDASALSSTASSPALGPQHKTTAGSERFNETYPSLHHSASTSSFSSSMPSMPSTPTSMRSRSPSISSLDTIEDEPDLESEAIENERIQRLKLAAERQERLERGEPADDGGGVRRRSSLDVPRAGFGRVGGSSSSRERKRWSICGGERRGDLDLETIWED